MPELGAPQLTSRTCAPARGCLAFLVGSHRNLEVIRIRQAVTADKPQLRQAQWHTEILAHKSGRARPLELDAELTSARDDHQIAQTRLDDPIFSWDSQVSHMGHNQHLGVRIAKDSVFHGAPCGIDVHRHALLTVLVSRCRTGWPSHQRNRQMRNNPRRDPNCSDWDLRSSPRTEESAGYDASLARAGLAAPMGEFGTDMSADSARAARQKWSPTRVRS